jgi:hypothetical protein
MTEFVDVPGGRIAFDVDGSGPLAVLSHGIGVGRQAYRFLAPMPAQAGCRVASADRAGTASPAWAGRRLPAPTSPATCSRKSSAKGADRAGDHP